MAGADRLRRRAPAAGRDARADARDLHRRGRHEAAAGARAGAAGGAGPGPRGDVRQRPRLHRRAAAWSSSTTWPSAASTRRGRGAGARRSPTACEAVGCAPGRRRDGGDAGPLRARPLRPGRLRRPAWSSARRCSGPDRVRRGRRDRRAAVVGAALQRLLAGAGAGRRRGARARPGPAARADPALRARARGRSPSGGGPARGGPHHRRRAAREPAARAAARASAPSCEAGSWEPGPAIAAVMATGRVAEEEAWRTFNMGLGHVRDRARTARPAAAPVDGARVVGRVVAGRRACRRCLGEPFRVSVLVSGSGTNLQSLIDTVHEAGRADRDRAGGVSSRAGRPRPGARRGAPASRTEVVALEGREREERDRELAGVVAARRARARGARRAG